MNNNYSYIYESAQLENFQKQIMSGYLTESKLLEMHENNQLTEQQKQIVQELFGGLSNIGRAIGSGISGAAQGAANVAKKGYNAAAAGAKQIGQNVSNIYQTGEQARKAAAQIATLQKLLTQVQQVIANAQQINPQIAQFIGKDPRLSNLIKQVNQIADTASRSATAAQQGGFTKGAGSAMQQGYNA